MTSTTIKSSASPGDRTLDVFVRDDGLVNLSVNHAGFNCGIQISTAALCAALGFEEAVRSRAEEITNTRGSYWISSQHHQAILEKCKAEVEGEFANLRTERDEMRKALEECGLQRNRLANERDALAAKRDEFEAEKDGAWAEAGRLARRATKAEANLAEAETRLKYISLEATELREIAKRATSSEATFAYNTAANWLEAALGGHPGRVEPPEPFKLPSAFGTVFWAKTSTDVWVEFKVCRNYSVPPECEQQLYVTKGSAAYDARKVMRLFKDHTLEEPAADEARAHV